MSNMHDSNLSNFKPLKKNIYPTWIYIFIVFIGISFIYLCTISPLYYDIFVLYKKARSSLAIKDYEQAIYYYEELLKQDTNSKPIRIALARAHFGLGTEENDIKALNYLNFVIKEGDWREICNFMP